MRIGTNSGDRNYRKIEIKGGEVNLKDNNN